MRRRVDGLRPLLLPGAAGRRTCRIARERGDGACLLVSNIEEQVPRYAENSFRKL